MLTDLTQREIPVRNIAVFVKNLTSGGAEKQSVLLAKALSGTYHVHYIIFNAERTHKKYLDMLQVDTRISVRGFTGNIRCRYRSFIDYLKEHQITDVFSYLTAANVFASLAGRQLGINIYTGLRNSQLPFAKRIADRFITNHVATLAIANCYSGRENFIKQGFSENKITVIPNCFENIAHTTSKPEKDTVQIITVGRFVKQKDYKTAIRAVADLHTRTRNITYHIVGYGKLELEIRKWILEYGIGDITQIHINPDNIPQLLENSDIYLSTSLFEGTSNSILEAMNADLPIVATNVGDNAMLITDNINGFLCGIKDPAKLAENLERLVCSQSLRLQMGKAGKRKLEDDYSMEKLRNNYIKVLHRL